MNCSKELLASKTPEQTLIVLTVNANKNESPAELKRILELRADPNATLPNSKIRPMDNILTFAPADKIAVMREMLLEHGATETAEDKRYWKLRQVNDAYETKRVQAFYEDDRHLSPIGAAMGL